MLTAGERVTHLQGRGFQEQHAEGVCDRRGEREDPGEAQQRRRGGRTQSRVDRLVKTSKLLL